MKKINVLYFTLAVFSAYSLRFCFYIDIYNIMANSIFSVFLVFIFYKLLSQMKTVNWKFRKIVFSIGLSFLYSVFLVLGQELYYYGNINFTTFLLYIKIICLLIVIFPIIILLLEYFDNSPIESKKMNKNIKFCKYKWMIVFFVLIVLWIPALLGMYPGIVDPDCSFEFYMYHYKDFTAQHPFTHVLLMNFIFDLGKNIFGNYNDGVALYVVLQMFAFSGAITYMLKFLYKHGLSFKMVVFITIFLGLNPLIQMNVITTTKDILFTSAFLMSIVLYGEFTLHSVQRNRYYVMYILFSLLACLLRNNAVYAYVVFHLIMIIMRRDRVKQLITGGCILLLYVSITFFVTNLLEIKPGPIQEKYGVPIQQLARTYVQEFDSFSATEKATVNELFKDEDISNYNGYCVDYIKFSMNQDNFKDNPRKYITLWLKKGMEFPTVYLNAFLENTLYIWYPDIMLHPYNNYTDYDKVQLRDTYLVLTNVNEPAYLAPKSRLLNKYYMEVAHGDFLQTIPFISMTISIGAMFWVFIFFLAFALYKKKDRVIQLMLLPLIYTLTLFLGPVVLSRYFVYLLILSPIFIAVLFEKMLFEK